MLGALKLCAGQEAVSRAPTTRPDSGASVPARVCIKDGWPCSEAAAALLLTYIGLEDKIPEVREAVHSIPASELWDRFPAVLAQHSIVLEEQLLSPKGLLDYGDYVVLRLKAEDGHAHWVLFVGSADGMASFLDADHFRTREVIQLAPEQFAPLWDGFGYELDREATAAALAPPPPFWKRPAVIASALAGVVLAWFLIFRMKRPSPQAPQKPADVP